MYVSNINSLSLTIAENKINKNAKVTKIFLNIKDINTNRKANITLQSSRKICHTNCGEFFCDYFSLYNFLNMYAHFSIETNKFIYILNKDECQNMV